MKAFLLGRSKECDVVIVDPTVSRRHAEFVVKSDNVFVLVDCGSKFGTFIRRGESWQPVQSEPVRIDDRIRLGQHETTIRTIMSVVVERLRATAAGRPAAPPPPDPPSQSPPPAPPRKAVIERDPETGEIITRK
jgi:pSer/pThr/pTyr-binding forkhead associated (FHA) protein